MDLSGCCSHLQGRLIEESDELSCEDNNYLFSQELCTERERRRYTTKKKKEKNGKPKEEKNHKISSTGCVKSKVSIGKLSRDQEVFKRKENLGYQKAVARLKEAGVTNPGCLAMMIFPSNTLSISFGGDKYGFWYLSYVQSMITQDKKKKNISINSKFWYQHFLEQIPPYGLGEEENELGLLLNLDARWLEIRLDITVCEPLWFSSLCLHCYLHDSIISCRWTCARTGK